MLILSLTYKSETDKADAHMQAHIAWLKQGYEKGWFIASGRKVPRTGGIILASGDRTEIEQFCATDPFKVHGVADYDIIEVAFSMTAQGLEALKDQE